MDTKILISGTGRSGTTFLIKLFSFMGLDTGFNSDNYEKYIHQNCNAGMEKSIDSPNYILKNPLFIEIIDDIMKRNIKIKWMIIPIRDYQLSANSRMKMGPNQPGGLRNACDLKTQMIFYHKIMANYLLKMVEYDIPTIFIHFDKMITDRSYLYNKLKVILDEHQISENTFNLYYELASQSSKPSSEHHIH